MSQWSMVQWMEFVVVTKMVASTVDKDAESQGRTRGSLSTATKRKASLAGWGRHSWRRLSFSAPGLSSTPTGRGTHDRSSFSKESRAAVGFLHFKMISVCSQPSPFKSWRDVTRYLEQPLGLQSGQGDAQHHTASQQLRPDLNPRFQPPICCSFQHDSNLGQHKCACGLTSNNNNSDWPDCQSSINPPYHSNHDYMRPLSCQQPYRVDGARMSHTTSEQVGLDVESIKA